MAEVEADNVGSAAFSDVVAEAVPEVSE